MLTMAVVRLLQHRELIQAQGHKCNCYVRSLKCIVLRQHAETLISSGADASLQEAALHMCMPSYHKLRAGRYYSMCCFNALPDIEQRLP